MIRLNNTNSVLMVLFFGLGLPIIGSILSAVFFSDLRFPYEPVHSVLEGLGGFIALSLAAMLIAQKQSNVPEPHFTIMACALFSMGLLDIFHASVSVGNLFVWLHSTAQFFGGFFFAFVWFSKQIGSWVLPRRLSITCFLGIIGFGFCSILFPNELPAMVSQEKFTFLARAFNILGGIGFIIATGFFLIRFCRNREWNDYIFSIHTLLFGSAGILFELSELWDPAWWWWHLLRLLAYSAGFYFVVSEYLKTQSELVSYRNDLESLVEVRTSQLKMTNEQLLHSEKLTALGKLTGSIAHEFNNPLFGLRNIIEEVNDETQNEDLKKLLKLGLKECCRMSDLISRLSDFYRPTSGKARVVEISRAVDDVSLLLRNDFVQRNIRLQKHYAANLPKVYTVEDQLKQVFLNLMQNAEEAIPDEGGTITISTWQNGKNVQVSIEDTGTGISPEILKSIFEPFFTTKSSVKGSGLGLSVSHGIMSKLNGKIDVQSKPNEGSIFTISIPFLNEEKVDGK